MRRTVKPSGASSNVPWLRSLTDIQVAANELDSILWDLLQHCSRLHIPQGDEGLGVECVLG